MSDSSSSSSSGEEVVNCGSGNDYSGNTGLRAGAVFIILFSSLATTLFPILSLRFFGTSENDSSGKGKTGFRIPAPIYEFAKFFGSGVIIATAFIHLLDPAIEELSSPCLTGGWTEYPWALALSMTSVFSIFILELLAFRVGHQVARKLGYQGDQNQDAENGNNWQYDPHSHAHAAHGPEAVEGVHSLERASTRPGTNPEDSFGELKTDPDAKPAQVSVPSANHSHVHSTFNMGPSAQIVGVAILEFGIVFHSVIIGLTLGVTDDFITLFIVIIFHQMFEGLGLGTRLATLPLPNSSRIPYFGALLYSLVTPIGISIGLGVRTSYNPEGATASKVSGILDAISSGILLYTGLVELLAHEFIFNDSMRRAPMGKLLYALGCMLTGAGVMALLGKWA